MSNGVFTRRDLRQSVDFIGDPESTAYGPFEGQVLTGIFIPDTGWTAASLTFEATRDGETWYPIYDAQGTGKYTIGPGQNPATGGYVALDMNLFYGVKWLRIVQNGTNTATIYLSLT